jgi:hypothetical protein
MRVGFDGRVRYALPLGEGQVDLEPFLGGSFTLRATGGLSCVCCGRAVKKFYGQGMCFPCLRDSPEASECIIRPELCQAHVGGGRNAEWEREHHHCMHVVYLSCTGQPTPTGGIKVGVTRGDQVPVRWIDQGAVVAVVVARVPYRQLAGLIEVDLKRILTDRTDWRAMLRLVTPNLDALHDARRKVLATVDDAFREYMLPDEPPQVIDYPVLAYPAKVTSVNLLRTPEVSGRLVGIKGQYLMWEDGRVLNVRSHSGFHVAVEQGLEATGDLFSTAP